MANVLILEDDLTLRHELTDGLRDYGHDCDCVGTVPEAMSALHRSRYDIVIADMYILQNGELSPEGGVSLIGWMRTFKYRLGPMTYLGETPIIVITGAGSTNNQLVLHMAVNVGATIALRKPVSVSELDAKIGRLTARPIAQTP